MENDSNQPEVILDSEFQMLLPPLEESVFMQIEQSMIEHGIRDPLVLWNGILIDGYNRYKISQTHNLPFNTVSMEFPSRDEVTIWIIKNQNERRNLTPMQHRFYRGLHYHTEKRIISNAQGRNQHNVVGAQNEHQPPEDEVHEKTATRLARHYNISSATIRRDAQLATAILAIGEISPDIKMDILTGRLHVSNVQLHELASGTEDDIKTLIKQIEDGTFVSRQPRSTLDTDPDSDSHEMQPWEQKFTKMTDDFRHVLRTHAKKDDTKSVKSALRDYISMLEDLYKNI